MNGYIGLLGFTGGRTLSFEVVDVILKYLRLQGGSAGSAQNFERYVQAVEAHGIRLFFDNDPLLSTVASDGRADAARDLLREARWQATGGTGRLGLRDHPTHAIFLTVPRSPTGTVRWRRVRR